MWCLMSTETVRLIRDGIFPWSILISYIILIGYDTEYTQAVYRIYSVHYFHLWTLSLKCKNYQF